jgi:hypothetical protein
VSRYSTWLPVVSSAFLMSGECISITESVILRLKYLKPADLRINNSNTSEIPVSLSEVYLCLWTCKYTEDVKIVSVSPDTRLMIFEMEFSALKYVSICMLRMWLWLCRRRTISKGVRVSHGKHARQIRKIFKYLIFTSLFPKLFFIPRALKKP